MRKMWFIPVIVLAVILLVVGTAGALDMFKKNLAGQGQMEFTDQVDVTLIRVSAMTSVKVGITSNANTVAGRVYTVHLLLDGVDVAQQTTSWVVNQIPGKEKKINFDNLDLADTIFIDVEVTH